MNEPVDCYDVPRFWDLAFSEDTKLEADFIQAAAAKYCDFPVKSIYEPGCGGGRLIVELAERGLLVTGIDQSGAAIEFASQVIAKNGLKACLQVGDMRDELPGQTFDLAYCLVNTFRHLVTEEDAVRHLQSVASMLRPGGLYIIGMHLLPPDADEEDEEEWTVESDDVSVLMELVVAGCDRKTRLENLEFTMTANVSGQTAPIVRQSTYQMRTYEAQHMSSLLAKVPSFQLVDVYDFWYDIEEPLVLSDELGDTVFVLKQTSTED